MFSNRPERDEPQREAEVGEADADVMHDLYISYDDQQTAAVLSLLEARRIDVIVRSHHGSRTHPSSVRHRVEQTIAVSTPDLKRARLLLRCALQDGKLARVGELIEP